jgi:hypothetical protein
MNKNLLPLWGKSSILIAAPNLGGSVQNIDFRM